ncbi:MAG TPA: glycoside hydrolase family 3 N-terminal domain-containing protein [Flavobacteriaceae bacterium]|nr:serine hydrolase [Flavobacteriaceae bacterium]MCB9213147.1 serine hydrolase [Alteromonas sp.]HPF10181.1 glycoside hydrolase family 3 N-terminal domain-containing protein [Flavobacteriaceae bacterium]HQU21665.1 glycoside hydrolase family 3 N-terminal domain-containing protein [Flavobacteriaceae bacterium]HQU66300.1 glycoside hydrolase family 3 N-terminal domain-containing protein [Flavobacteriaceae bacterium]
MKRIVATSLIFLLYTVVFAQQINPLLVENDLENQQKWVDSIYGNMSLQEKVGQLFMVDVFSSDPKSKTDKIDQLIDEYYIGGVIFSKGGPVRQAMLTNEFQNRSKVPLLIGMDAEWGLAMRLDSTFAYPWNMTLGAIKNDSLVKEVGKRIGIHCKRLGVHFNFAPVVDINTNPLNPIIGNRSFGEERENVYRKSLAFMEGMQGVGVLATAKHFPGHGDTDADSHKILPTLSFDKNRMDSLELYPYKNLIPNGLSSVMVAHLNIPAFVSEPGYPSSISKDVVTDLLQGELGFNGLIFTDALNMKGAADFKEPGAIDLAAFLAGNDVLLISEDIPKAHALLINAFREGVITEERLAYSVKKILMAKYKAGLEKYQPIVLDQLVEDLNAPEDEVLLEASMESALTLVKNDSLVLPIRNLQDKKIAYINFGDASGSTFLQYLNKYADVDWVKAKSLDEYIAKLSHYDFVIMGFHKSNDNPWKDYKIEDKELVWMYEIARTNKVILDVFTRPYALLDIKTFANFDAVVVSYQNSEVSQQLSAQLIFGARGALGVLPVSIASEFPAGTSLTTEPLGRLQYGVPESVGVDHQKLKKIDTLARNGFWAGMYPGAQILVAKKGKVIYQKSFGYHTPKKEIRVKDTDLYDVASLTKILATLPLIMELYDRNVINMDTKLSEMLPYLKGSNKEDITLKRMLSHYARFQAWIPFYTKTLDSVTGGPSIAYYSSKKEGEFSIQVAKDLYMRKDYVDSIFVGIKDSELRSSLSYKYSDLPYYLMKKYLEEFFGHPLDDLVQRDYYESLGCNHTTYKPLEKFPISSIPPTEEDNYFRMQRIQGYVHDQGAAMLGGVSGHAGLFSNATDIAKIMQMYLWKGYYGGKRYFKAETFDAFNTCYFCPQDVRRGVGFDKPQLGDSGPTCGCVSMTSFGHSGFTGTFAWADPEEEIVYVFLSNRTYPDAENRMLISSDLRSRIQEAIYEAIIR